MKTYLLAWLLLGLAATCSLAQRQPTPPTGTYRVILTDGTTLRGTIVSRDSTQLVLQTKAIGTVIIPTDSVARMVHLLAAGVSPGTVYPNLFPQYMQLTPTAFQAEKGHAYYRCTTILANQFDYGVSKNWSVGADIWIVGPPIVWLRTKVSLPITSFIRVGVQGQLGLALRERLEPGGLYGFSVRKYWERVNYLQGLLSIGSSQRNVTIGAGITNFPITEAGGLLTIGIVQKISPLLTFISENKFVAFTERRFASAGVVSGGLRFDRARHSFDLSLQVPLSIGRNELGPFGAAVFPLASYQVRIAK